MHHGAAPKGSSPKEGGGGGRRADQGASRWTTRWTPGLPIALMVVLLVLPTAGSAQVGQTATVKIGFGQTLPDREIVDLLDGYPGVEVTAARLQVADIKSSHRNADGMPVDRFAPEVRTKMAKHFRGSVERSLFRLRRVVEKYDAAAVDADPALAEEVRSELDIGRRLEHAASTHANGEPVIFALEISGEGAALQQVVEDERVRVHRFVGQGLFGADDLDFQIPKTEPPTSDWDVDSLSGAQAYERAREAVRQGRIETDGGG